MTYVLWILQVLLALLFLFAGSSKFMMSVEEMNAQSPMAMPGWFIHFIGICEILGGLGLVLPWLLKIKPNLTPLAAALLAVIMAGAVVISAMASPATAIIPLVIGLLLAFVAYGRWKLTPVSN
jgi:uncharacterized membrane protein YphA (DoxX/SURF4 family)